MPQSTKPYRPNAGIIVFNAKGLVLAGERIDSKNEWQLPQGGINENETPRKAAKRELFEEVGLELDKPVAEIKEWLYYEFPENIVPKLKMYRGQKQKWFLFFWDGNPEELKLDLHEQEFDQVAWKEFAFVQSQIVIFKQELYKQLSELAIPLMDQYLNSRKE